MSDTRSGPSTTTTVFIAATREAVYRACVDPDALVIWRTPGEMTAKVHAFDLRVGGGYEMSLYYPESEPEGLGKTGGREDRFTARYLELVPPERIVEAIAFDSAEAAFTGELIMTVTLTERDGGTELTMRFDNLPPGVRPEDNDAGTQFSLAKLASYLERGGTT